MKITHKKSRFTLFVALSAFAASGATLQPAQAQFSKISESEEIRAGQQSRAQAIKEYGRPLPANDPRQRRVARIGAEFARIAQRRTIPYSYTVLQNDKVLNAFAAPGGPIFVTTKLLSVAANDAELAYVIGHETGHIDNKHIVNSIQKQQQVGLGVGILGAILGNRYGGAVGSIASVGYALWDRGFSRDQERDADVYGVRAMARLGYNPRAAMSMLGKLGGNTSGLSKYLATHPSPESRQQLVAQLIERENLIRVASQAGSENFSENPLAPSTVRATEAASIGRLPIENDNPDARAIQLRVVSFNGYRVVMAPVKQVADFAGGRIEADNRTRVAVVSRGGNSIQLKDASTDAVLNGRRVRLSAPAQIIEGRFFAPAGALSQGLGGEANYDSTSGIVTLDFGQGRRAGFEI